MLRRPGQLLLSTVHPAVDEADFIEGIDPSHDIVDDEGEEEKTTYSPEAPSALERGRGRERSKPLGNRSCSRRSTGKQLWTRPVTRPITAP
ncbi:hypothetical protein ATANTOWER_019945 [Ataeniobius toweri]|uniref:Uncharacterized protein n=1 Tax=Ataeniobius toweri TaxID=208326 RepID=A0ABU7C9H4_9TELE|nr:hypothetical protein [Ataeniobius toweri]